MITTKKMNSFKQKHFTGESTDNKPTTCGVNSFVAQDNSNYNVPSDENNLAFITYEISVS